MDVTLDWFKLPEDELKEEWFLGFNMIVVDVVFNSIQNQVRQNNEDKEHNIISFSQRAEQQATIAIEMGELDWHTEQVDITTILAYPYLGWAFELDFSRGTPFPASSNMME